MNGTREKWHGTSGGYSNHACRCPDCKAANAIEQRAQARRRLARPVPARVHGTDNGYTNYRCRCDDCRTAHRRWLEAKCGRTIHPRASKLEIQLLRDWKEADRVNRAINRRERELPRLLRRIDRHLRASKVRTPRKTFEQMYIVNPVTECWEWQGKLHAGYGSFGGTTAYRWSYLNAGKSIPEGFSLDHVCHTNDRSCPGGKSCVHRSCVNPDHLEAVTQAENFRRGDNPAAITIRTGVCHNGHPFEGENVRVREHDPRKNRECVQCNRDRCKRYRAKKKARLAEKRVNDNRVILCNNRDVLDSRLF